MRLGDDVVALADRCARRFSKLSVGKVVDGEVQCPYHGWRCDGGGYCTRIPAAPEVTLPKKPVAESYEARVKYDIAWVRLDSSWDLTDIPFCRAWENPAFEKIIVASPNAGRARRTGAERILPTSPTSPMWTRARSLIRPTRPPRSCPSTGSAVSCAFI